MPTNESPSDLERRLASVVLAEVMRKDPATTRFVRGTLDEGDTLPFTLEEPTQPSAPYELVAVELEVDLQTAPVPKYPSPVELQMSAGKNLVMDTVQVQKLEREELGALKVTKKVAALPQPETKLETNAETTAEKHAEKHAKKHAEKHAKKHAEKHAEKHDRQAAKLATQAEKQAAKLATQAEKQTAKLEHHAAKQAAKQAAKRAQRHAKQAAAAAKAAAAAAPRTTQRMRATTAVTRTPTTTRTSSTAKTAKTEKPGPSALAMTMAFVLGAMAFLLGLGLARLMM